MFLWFLCEQRAAEVLQHKHVSDLQFGDDAHSSGLRWPDRRLPPAEPAVVKHLVLIQSWTSEKSIINLPHLEPALIPLPPCLWADEEVI